MDRDEFAGFCSELLECQEQRPPLFFFCNPNNPTGRLLSREQVLSLKRLIHEQVSQDSVLVVDEAFIDFVEDERGSSVRWAAVADPRLVVTGSLTKMFALPGLRVGYAVASPQVIVQLQELQLPWSVNALAQRAAQELPGLGSFVSRTRRVVQEERDYLFEQFNRLPQLQVFPSATNYLLMKMNAQNHSVTELEDFLGQRGYLIRNCDNFEGLGEGFFRTAVKGRKANRKLIELICRFFGENRGDN
jgi:threonine-phosphate decarboxylase